MIALKGLPTVDEVPLSNAILEALLDLLDGQSERRSVPSIPQQLGYRRSAPAFGVHPRTPNGAARS
jgi:hypothetical protein